MIHNSKLININKSSSLIYMQHIQNQNEKLIRPAA